MFGGGGGAEMEGEQKLGVGPDVGCSVAGSEEGMSRFTCHFTRRSVGGR